MDLEKEETCDLNYKHGYDSIFVDTIILIMTLLIMTFLLMTKLFTFNAGDILCNVITYN